MISNAYELLWQEIENDGGEKSSTSHIFPRLLEYNDLIENMPNFSNEYLGKDISDEVKYSFRKTFVKFEFSESIENYSDSLFSFSIYDKDKGVSESSLARLSFDFSDNEEMIISQIQGVHGKFPGRELPLDWDEVLLNIAIQFSYAYKLSLFFPRAENLPFYNSVQIGDTCLASSDSHKARMIKRYDLLALKNGFVYNSEKDVYEYAKA